MSGDAVQLSTMESCVAVEKEIDRVINKFTTINEHSSQVIGDVVNHILALKNQLEEGKCGREFKKPSQRGKQRQK